MIKEKPSDTRVTSGPCSNGQSAFPSGGYLSRGEGNVIIAGLLANRLGMAANADDTNVAYKSG